MEKRNNLKIVKIDSFLGEKIKDYLIMKRRF